MKTTLKKMFICIVQSWFLIAIFGVCVSTPVNALVVQTIGAGTAVTRVDLSANFENPSSLFGNPYVEDGLSFSRTNLSFNNNSCGYAGCGGFLPYGFSGNYMYGTGGNGLFAPGYFTITVGPNAALTGLEFLVGAGNPTANELSWEAFFRGTDVGQGVSLLPFGNFGSVVDLGFSGGNFDTLQFTVSFPAGVTGFPESAPAFDTVTAQLLVQDNSPLPAALPLFATGLGGVMGLLGWRRKRKAAALAA